MNDEQIAAEGAKRFAAQFLGFIKAAELLGEVGSIKQAGDEAQTRLDALKTQEADTAAKIEADKVAAAEHLKSVNAEIESNKDAAANHIANRTAEAETIVSAAQTKAQQTMAEAQASAGRIVDDANQAVASVKNRLGELSNMINDRTNEIAALDVTIVTRQQTLDGINAQIAALRAKF